MFIKWLNISNEIHLHEKIIEQYNIGTNSIVVQYGCLKEEMKVIKDNSIGDLYIGIPRIFAKGYTIPDNLTYEIVLDDRTLKIGPFIAYMPTANLARLHAKALNSQEKRMSIYNKINGLFVVTAANGIDIKNQTIEGYYYNPNGNQSNGRWVKGIFPYPNVLFKRRRLSKQKNDDLISKIGKERIINSNLFNKEQLWQRLSKDEQARPLLPYTERFRNWQQLKKWMDVYPIVYLKPRDGSHGDGIIKVEKNQQNKITFINKQRKKCQIGNDKEGIHYLSAIRNKPYLIQQGIESIHFGHNVDFRAYLQKNYDKRWIIQGIVARVARKDSIVTNLAYVKKLLMWDDACKQIFSLGRERKKELHQKVEKACKTVCNAIDQHLGSYGDVAIDFIIDRDFNIFILEINKSYTVKSLRILNETALLQKILTTPLQYAKRLAGF